MQNKLPTVDSLCVLSLKKYMEVQLEQLLHITRDAYRAALTAIGDSSVQAHPLLGQDLQQKLDTLEQRLSAADTCDAVKQTEREVKRELHIWAQRTAEYYKQKTAEVKEIMMMVVRTAESVSDRDTRFTGQMNQLMTSLETIADLDDLSSVRRSLLRTTGDLKACVRKMERDGKDSVAQLRAELAIYQTRVSEVERLASCDALTGLANRRELERQLEVRIGAASPFCVMMFDLNEFKEVNDIHGHPVGDEVLRQFARELLRFFRSTDVVGRWGGDEFLVIVNAGLGDSKARIRGIESWLYGQYKIETAGITKTVAVSAAVGVAGWNPGETVMETVQRADAAMYARKKASKISTT